MAVDFDFEVILQAMKKAAGALRDAEVPFALGGGLAVLGARRCEDRARRRLLREAGGRGARAAGLGPVGDDWLERAEELDVYAVTMLVASLDDVLVTKLLALTEQNLDYSSVLEVARAVREQLDWDEVRRRCEGSPYAKAFLVLVEELGGAPAGASSC